LIQEVLDPKLFRRGAGHDPGWWHHHGREVAFERWCRSKGYYCVRDDPDYKRHRIPRYPPATRYPEAREALLRAERFIPSCLKEWAKSLADSKPEEEAGRINRAMLRKGYRYYVRRRGWYRVTGERSSVLFLYPPASRYPQARQVLLRAEQCTPSYFKKYEEWLVSKYGKPDAEQIARRMKRESPRMYYPDFFVVFTKQLFGFVEVKSSRGKLETSQRSVFPELVEKAGQYVWLVRIEFGRSLHWYRIESNGELVPLSDFGANSPSKKRSS